MKRAKTDILPERQNIRTFAFIYNEALSQKSAMKVSTRDRAKNQQNKFHDIFTRLKKDNKTKTNQTNPTKKVKLNNNKLNQQLEIRIRHCNLVKIV